MWFQTTDEQFDSGTLTDTETYGSDQVRLSAGSTTTYNFVGASPGGTHYAGERGNAAPANPDDGFTQALQGDYDDIEADDDTNVWQTSLANNNNEYDSQVFRFYIDEDEADVSQLYVQWQGYSSEVRAGYDLSFFIWNYETSSWTQINSDSNGSTTEVDWSQSYTSSPGDYIDTDKEVALYARFEHYEGGGFCFVAGTKITMADGSHKNIEDVKIGDMVLTTNMETMELEPNRVLELASPIHEDIVHLTFEHSENKNTFDHPYYVKGKGWSSYKPEWTKQRYGIDAKQLEVGDICYFLDEDFKLQESKLLSIEEIWGEVQTYNLKRVENNHNFFANSILVHNKFCAYLFSELDEEEHFEFVTLGVFEERENYN